MHVPRILESSEGIRIHADLGTPVFTEGGIPRVESADGENPGRKLKMDQLRHHANGLRFAGSCSAGDNEEQAADAVADLDESCPLFARGGTKGAPAR